MPDVASADARRRRNRTGPPRTAEGAGTPRIRRGQYPDLSGMTIGTWRVLYEAEGEERAHCMCRCVRCGVKKIIMIRKFLRGYALRCPECRIRQVSEVA
jgi:hypothetical protein